MKFIKNIILVLVIACMQHQDIACKGPSTETGKDSLKKTQSIPATLKDALKAINKKLKSPNIKKKDIEYLKRAQKAIEDVQKQL